MLIDARAAVATAMLCATLTAHQPAAHAAGAYLETDVAVAQQRLKRATEDYLTSSRAVLRAQTLESIAPYAASVADLVLSTDAGELTKLVNVGLDAVLSVPPDSAAKVTGVAKEAFSGLSAETCDIAPVPLDAFQRLAQSPSISAADSSKRKAVVERLQPVWQAVPKRAGVGICLPSSAKLEAFALAQVDAVDAADREAVRAVGEQAQATLRSVKKAGSFKLFAELGQQQRNVLTRAPLQERERFKKAVAELADASVAVDELKTKQAAGPPKCFTIGCQTNFEYDLWRADSKNDYTTGKSTGVLEKPNGILKPKGYTFDKE